MDKPTLKPEGDWAEIIASLEAQMAAPVSVIDAKTGKEPHWAKRIGVKRGPKKPKPPLDPNAPKKKRGRPAKPKDV